MCVCLFHLCIALMKQILVIIVVCRLYFAIFVLLANLVSIWSDFRRLLIVDCHRSNTLPFRRHRLHVHLCLCSSNRSAALGV